MSEPEANNTPSPLNYKSLEAARDAGFRLPRANEYGGEQITVEGRQLVRDPKRAKSAVEWLRNGYSVIDGSKPHGWERSQEPKKRSLYPVYRDDQVRPTREITERPAEQIPLLVALWVVNYYANLLRFVADSSYRGGMHKDASKASQQKKKCLDLKDQGLHYLAAEGKIAVTGYRRMGPDWAEVLEGDGYTFYRPCPPPGDGLQDVKILAGIEAKPKGVHEPRLTDAFRTLENYLADKPKVAVYRWRPRNRKAKLNARRHENQQGLEKVSAREDDENEQ